jgi:hypothetical protein
LELEWAWDTEANLPFRQSCWGTQGAGLSCCGERDTVEERGENDDDPKSPLWVSLWRSWLAARGGPDVAGAMYLGHTSDWDTWRMLRCRSGPDWNWVESGAEVSRPVQSDGALAWANSAAARGWWV